MKRFGQAVWLIMLAAVTGVCTGGAAWAQNANSGFAARVVAHQRPRLTVVISIDQFRADYLRRDTALFLPAKNGDTLGGFRYLMTRGAYFLDARYKHFPLYTGPGHAVILTGGDPYKTGIIANDWWDKTTQSRVYCVDDARQKVVGAIAGSTLTPMGPLNLRSTTVGDELKLASGGQSKVVTVSLKDRAAILLGGHAQDVSVWYDPAGGRWVSSTAYCKDGKLPAWVEALNGEHLPDKTLGTTWNAQVPADALAQTIPVPARVPGPSGIGRAFPHPIGAAKTAENYQAFTLTPDANAYVFTTAERAVTSEKLGQRGGDTPDLLALNLATNDYVGHAFGPFSAEALDVTIQTDHQISGFLNFLQRTIPGGLDNVVVVVTADHGAVGIPENLSERGIPGGRILESTINSVVEKALSEEFGGDITWVGKNADGKTVGTYVESYVSLNEAAITQALRGKKAGSRAEIEAAAARAVETVPGIYACYTRSQIRAGALPDTEIAHHIVRGFYPGLSGDVLVITQPQFFIEGSGGTGTTHGTPYIYDTHVPLLIAGPGIQSGVYTGTVSPADIAPTLCALLGIAYPSACDGTILPSVR